MQKNIIRTAFVAAFALMAGYSAYTSQQKSEMSDLVKANVEALADNELPEVIITCSRTCSDGTGRCYYKYDDWGNCHYNGDQNSYCIC